MEDRVIAKVKFAGPLTVATLAASTILFYLLVHQVSNVWLDVAMSPQVRAALQQSLDDQKRLNDLDPANGANYRSRFEATRTLLNRIEVIRINREAMLDRFETVMVFVFGATLGSVALLTWLRYRAARDRERREFSARLRGWQEAARRHAHEIRGPLTAARIEVERLVDLARSHGAAAEAERLWESVVDELDRLALYTREFSGFGALAQPVLRREPLHEVVTEFVTTFQNAWPELTIAPPVGPAVTACLDRDLLRQVLVNLCANSAHAVASGGGHVRFSIARERGRAHLYVSDDGAGIPQSLRSRIFDPYVTTRRVGEGMGLGLAISRKIMLDHGGDLELVSTSSEGTSFRLTFTTEECD